jgi:hypothetical protein
MIGCSPACRGEIGWMLPRLRGEELGRTLPRLRGELSAQPTEGATA